MLFFISLTIQTVHCLHWATSCITEAAIIFIEYNMLNARACLARSTESSYPSKSVPNWLLQVSPLAALSLPMPSTRRTLHRRRAANWKKRHTSSQFSVLVLAPRIYIKALAGRKLGAEGKSIHIFWLLKLTRSNSTTAERPCVAKQKKSGVELLYRTQASTSDGGACLAR